MRGFPARGRGGRRLRGARLAIASAIGGVLLAPGALLAAGEQPAAAPPQPVASTPVGAPAAAAGPKTVSGDPRAQTVDQAPPQAALTVSPDRPTAGEPLRLDAGASSGAIVRYRWDLNGDGTFETDSGTQAVLERALEAGSHRLAVRVEDAAGRSDESDATVTVAAPPQPSTTPAPAAPQTKAQPKPTPKRLAAKQPKVTSQPVVRAAAASSVTIQNFAFAPASVTVNTGDTVTWTNKDSAPHTATGSGGSFNTGTLKQGQSGSHTFQSAGSFAYICAIHPNMKGTVVVKGAGSSGGSGGGGSSAGSGGGSATPSTPSASAGTSGSGSPLPHTGLGLLAVVLVGIALSGTGLVLRTVLDRTQHRG